MQKKITMLIVGLISTMASLYGQGGQNGSWSFVGPYSNNNANGQEFEASHMNSIIYDPNNASHLFACSKFAGLWESVNGGASWDNINTTPTGLNGVLGIAFKSSTELLVGNYHPVHTGDYSTNVSIYDFQNQTWQNLTPLPSGGTEFVIKSVAVHPTNSSILFACTSMGLFRSSDGGVTWTMPISGCVENMVFMPKLGSGYYCYAAGSNLVGDHVYPLGTTMLKESSDDGNTFSTISVISIGTQYTRSHTKIALGPVNSGTGISELLTLTVATSGAVDIPYGWDGATSTAHYVHRLGKNINTNSPVSLISQLVYAAGAHPSSDRMAITYDPYNGIIWYGTQNFYFYDLNNSSYGSLNTSFRTTNCNVHMDIHEVLYQSNSTPPQLYVACDGGLAKASLDLDSIVPDPPGPGDTVIIHGGGIGLGRIASGPPNPYSICFNRINYGLNVCLINGFSGSETQPNLFAIGAQDIINTDIYDANTQQNRYTHTTWENDGALIYKFDDNLMILDESSYSANYYVSTDNGATKGTLSGFYLPKSTSPFEANTSSPLGAIGVFGGQRFKQDPYRPGRIYGVGIVEEPRLMQFDFNAQKMVFKHNFGNGSAPSTVWNEGSADISFSPQTPNSMYLVTNGGPLNQGDPAARVYKYVGPNLDDSYWGHYENFDQFGNPQWQEISPNYAGFSSIGGGATNINSVDLGKVAYLAVETSPWNKELIYVACRIDFSGPNQSVKVLRYDGASWTNYSLGIPANEVVFSMVMDHESNDGIYLSTDKGVYFRDASMSNWINYSNDLPIITSKQMEINLTENTVRAGTYGMGIWKSSLRCPHQNTRTETGSIPPGVYEAANVIANGVATMAGLPTAFRGTNSVVLSPGFQAVGTATPNTYCLAYIHGCMSAGNSPSLNRNHTLPPAFVTSGIVDKDKEEEAEDVDIYPNPSTGKFIVETETTTEVGIDVYSATGRKILSLVKVGPRFEVDITGAPKGIYFINVLFGGKKVSKKIVVD